MITSKKRGCLVNNNTLSSGAMHMDKVATLYLLSLYHPINWLQWMLMKICDKVTLTVVHNVAHLTCIVC